MSQNRLQPENLTDFTGGLNYSTDQFSLADNESPDMMNIDLDPRSGFHSAGMAAADLGGGRPGHAVAAAQRGGAHGGDRRADDLRGQQRGDLRGPRVGVFTPMTGPVAQGTPHGADFVSWGEDVYFTNGMGQLSYRRSVDGSLLAMTPDVWSEVDAPVLDTMPQAGLCEGHAGYLFIARVREGAVSYNTRIRWSHPNRPDSWREQDYLDIDAYGGKITAILSFRDHLLIFKTTSMWALYGYGDDSWQLSLVSSSIGCPAITAVTKSETTVFFFSASNKNGIYAYGGAEATYISEKLRPAMSQITAFTNVFVSWANRKLYVAVPWKPVFAQPEPASLFIFDPDIGQGAWTMYSSPYGAVASVVDGSDINSKFPLAAFWSTHTACMLILDSVDDAYDEILTSGGVLTKQDFPAYYRTRWMHGGWPDVRKSWRRPMFICRRAPPGRPAGRAVP